MQLVVQNTNLLEMNPLAAVCFALGIAALMFMFRRLGARRNEPPAMIKEMESRFHSARHQIEQIAERELYHKLRDGHRFYRRGQKLSSQDLHVLSLLAAARARKEEYHG